jgi:hypothetical protein
MRIILHGAPNATTAYIKQAQSVTRKRSSSHLPHARRVEVTYAPWSTEATTDHPTEMVAYAEDTITVNPTFL